MSYICADNRARTCQRRFHGNLVDVTTTAAQWLVGWLGEGGRRVGVTSLGAS